MRNAAVLLSLALHARLDAAPIDVEPEDLRPSLVAEYRSLADPKATLTRTEAQPAFHLGSSSPHARLPPGPFTVTWTGVLQLRERGPITFEAFAGGRVSIEIDGVSVLAGQSMTDDTKLRGKAVFDARPGLFPVKIHYRALPNVPARLQLWWQAPAFAPEPIPAWRFSHVVSQRSALLEREELARDGKAMAGRFGCARCHPAAFPGVNEPPPGPALTDLRGRVSRDWLMRWLEDPGRLHADARMPALFSPDRTGFVERWLVANHLAPGKPAEVATPGSNHRLGRQGFLSVGCLACHFIPEQPIHEQPHLGRTPLRGLGDRMTLVSLSEFLAAPHGRYPEGRMPRLGLTPTQARDIAAYLLLWSPPSESPPSAPPAPAEIDAIRKRLSAANEQAAAVALLRERHCVRCHPGLEAAPTASIPIRRWAEDAGCLSRRTMPRFVLDDAGRKALLAYGSAAAQETHPSPFAERQRLLERAGCVRCHPRHGDRPSPLEVASSSVGGAYLQNVPFQKTPRLTFAHQKFERAHLVRAVRDSVTGLRVDRYTFRMPTFGADAEALVQALAEADGDLPTRAEEVGPGPTDPTLPPAVGPLLVGFQGYACVSCHLWKGQKLSEADPGNLGTDLTRVAGRIRRDWFERFLHDPARFNPGTPMPAIFFAGKSATLTSLLDGDARKQKDVLWHYFALGADAPSPKPPPPLAVDVPAGGPLLAQIPIHVGERSPVESITMLNQQGDLVIYDLGAAAVTKAYVGGRVLRHVQGRLRKYSADGIPVPLSDDRSPPLQLAGGPRPETPAGRDFLGFDRLDDGVRLRWRVRFPSATIEVAESLRIATLGKSRTLRFDVKPTGVPENRELAIRALGQATGGRGDITMSLDLPPAQAAPAGERTVRVDPGRDEGSLERPGYRAMTFPRPRTLSGEDRIMPGAVAVHPRDGRVFVASMKLGEILVIPDPDRGPKARIEDFAGGLFQEAYAMLAEDDGLYVLHRRNLTRLAYPETPGLSPRSDRIAVLDHGIGDTYDYAYGLARNRDRDFVFSFAPYANRTIPGSGGAISLRPGQPPREVAFGMRNPAGWCAGNDGEIFFTDNQGEWVATNKLVHAAPGHFFGFPNPSQKHHADRPMGKTSVWVPYAWARSINGVTYDTTAGKFGPFAGQFFLAELMYGGAILRADVEKVKGVFQGVCFPFWGKGLLGPVTLAFDPARGPLYVGSITEPGWMAQPDRGALFRIDFTGAMPFEMRTIRVQPRGFRIHFTRPVDPATAQAAKSYRIEHYRYEYTGAYGSPELDRTTVPIERLEVSDDGLRVDVTTAPLVTDRVYMIHAPGVRDLTGLGLVQPTGAYTLNEVPPG